MSLSDLLGVARKRAGLRAMLQQAKVRRQSRAAAAVAGVVLGEKALREAPPATVIVEPELNGRYWISIAPDQWRLFIHGRIMHTAFRGADLGEKRFRLVISGEPSLDRVDQGMLPDLWRAAQAWAVENGGPVEQPRATPAPLAQSDAQRRARLDDLDRRWRQAEAADTRKRRSVTDEDIAELREIVRGVAARHGGDARTLHVRKGTGSMRGTVGVMGHHRGTPMPLYVDVMRAIRDAGFDYPVHMRSSIDQNLERAEAYPGDRVLSEWFVRRQGPRAARQQPAVAVDDSAALAWTSPSYGEVKITEPRASGRTGKEWVNLSAEIGGKRMRFGWSPAQRRWSRSEVPPTDLVLEAVSRGWDFSDDPEVLSRSVRQRKPRQAAPRVQRAPAVREQVRGGPDAWRAAAMATLAPSEARALSSAARRKGESMVGKSEDDADRVGLQNTARRAGMGAARRERAGRELSWGRRLLALADAIDAGTYQPDAFDQAIVRSEGNRELAEQLWAQRRDLGDAQTSDYRGSGVWTWKTKPAAFFNEGAVRDFPSLLRVVKKHGRPDKNGYGFEVPVTPEAVEQISAAIRKVKSQGKKDVGRNDDDLKRLRAHLELGFFEKSDHDRIAARFDQFLSLFGDTRAARQRKQRQQRRKSEAALIGVKIPGFVPTPPGVVADMVRWAELESGERVLEPSAGKGDIADVVRDAADVRLDAVELNATLREILTGKGHRLVANDFLQYEPGPVYDKVLMNPPFEGLADIDHVRHAFELLRPGGRLVAIMGEGTFFREDKKAKLFRDGLLSRYAVHEQRLPEGAFLEGIRPTGVRARLVVLDKPVG